MKLEKLASKDTEKKDKSVAYANLILADIVGDGLLTSPDPIKAKDYLKKSVENGNLEASVNLGWLYFTSPILKDLDSAIKYTRKAAEEGDPEMAAYAYNNLGVIYEDRGRDQSDFINAEENYIKASEIARANEFSLGWMDDNLTRLYILGKLPKGIQIDKAKKHNLLATNNNTGKFFKSILDRNLIDKTSTLDDIKNVFEETILDGQTNGLQELAYIAEDDIETLDEAVKWFELCTLLCNGDSVKQSEESLDLIRNEISGKDFREGQFLARQWIADVWNERSQNSDSDNSYEPSPDILNKLGTYHALIIGNNNYDTLSKLNTATNDAEKINNVLKERFGFKTTLLIDGTRSEILDNLENYRKTLSEQDNFLFYYAGHGYLDKEIDKGYWQPVDATDRVSSWISNSDIVDQLKGLKAKHVLLVADSCFAGSLTRGITITKPDNSEDNEWLNKIIQLKGRTIMASGNLEPVSDSGRDGHSVFAYYFLKELNSVDQPVTGNQIFNAIKHKIMLNADQTPLYEQLERVGSEGGDFIFVKNE